MNHQDITRPVAYIAGPYRADTVNGIFENIIRARELSKRLWGKGYTVICPHMNSSLLDGICDDRVFLEGGLELLRRSDLVVLLNNYHQSAGTLRELDLANKLELPIFNENHSIPDAEDFCERHWSTKESKYDII